MPSLRVIRGIFEDDGSKTSPTFGVSGLRIQTKPNAMKACSVGYTRVAAEPTKHIFIAGGAW